MQVKGAASEVAASEVAASEVAASEVAASEVAAQGLDSPRPWLPPRYLGCSAKVHLWPAKFSSINTCEFWVRLE